jgi:hypothetical protein
MRIRQNILDAANAEASQRAAENWLVLAVNFHRPLPTAARAKARQERPPAQVSFAAFACARFSVQRNLGVSFDLDAGRTSFALFACFAVHVPGRLFPAAALDSPRSLSAVVNLGNRIPARRV